MQVKTSQTTTCIQGSCFRLNVTMSLPPLKILPEDQMVAEMHKLKILKVDSFYKNLKSLFKKVLFLLAHIVAAAGFISSSTTSALLTFEVRGLPPAIRHRPHFDCLGLTSIEALCLEAWLHR